MILRRFAHELAVLTVVCVLLIFYFPMLEGPYSAVHGPATAFQAAQAAARLRTGIAQGAISPLGSFFTSPLVILSWIFLSKAVVRPAILPECNAILRC